MADVIAAAPHTRVPVRRHGVTSNGTAPGDPATTDTFPVRRIYCVGRNFAEHAR